MTDDGHPFSFGVSLIPSVDLTEENRRPARAADQAGEALPDWTVELGFDTYIFWLSGSAAGQLETFARMAAPAVWQRVGDRRGTE